MDRLNNYDCKPSDSNLRLLLHRDRVSCRHIVDIKLNDPIILISRTTLPNGTLLDFFGLEQPDRKTLQTTSLVGAFS
ncbi:hypothetical protein [Paenibacillus sp. LHD-38]|uniref:hypothetical protein n=1 Tax=Paenibacillus sp. LHD-38 TaxID=3072143 RepID=UPI00280D4300|nr:hypothetical protein [Paenibacillus sp. LHD-38]MDQ8739440.1 hypothetical protein [Paenibacillus sp. LHD-38]